MSHFVDGLGVDIIAPSSSVPITREYGPWTPEEYASFMATGRAVDPTYDAPGGSAGTPATRPGSNFLGRPLTPNEQYVLAAAGGIVALSVIILLTRNKK